MEEEEKTPHKFKKMIQERGLQIAGVCAIVVLAAAVLTQAVFVSKKKKQGEIVAPGFTLRDQQGRLTSLAEFRGKVVVLTFIDPECSQLCPLTTQSMVEAVDKLAPGEAAEVQLLGIDANPLKTKVADVAAYTDRHELQGRWRFLTGTAPQLEKIWRDYHVYVAVEKNDIEHTAVVYLIDRNGNESGIYTTPMSYEAVGDQSETLAQGIAQLLPGHPAVAATSEASEQEVDETAPTQARTISLTGLGPKKQAVVLGSAHPHLVAFFAGWLGNGEELSKDLGALDSYAALAQKRGWPAPVAIDELTTEPSAAEARQVLMPLAARLRTPIIEDASGKIADGYNVGDLPWFTLNSNTGKILWHHDGWISAAELNKHVRAALAGSGAGRAADSEGKAAARQSGEGEARASSSTKKSSATSD